jgi:hypothetical protein
MQQLIQQVDIFIYFSINDITIEIFLAEPCQHLIPAIVDNDHRISQNNQAVQVWGVILLCAPII